MGANYFRIPRSLTAIIGTPNEPLRNPCTRVPPANAVSGVMPALTFIPDAARYFRKADRHIVGHAGKGSGPETRNQEEKMKGNSTMLELFRFMHLTT